MNWKQAEDERTEDVMQLLLILGITFAICAVSFALQNNIPVTIVLSSWRFDNSLAVVLLLTLGLGSLIAALVSTPGIVEGQWSRARLRRQIASVAREKEILEQRLLLLEQEIARPAADPAPAAERSARHSGLGRMPLSRGQDSQSGSAIAARIVQ